MESEGLDAVRLMTIHRAKGLEFPVVCVADLGRGPAFRHGLIRLSRDGARLGMLVGRPGTGRRSAHSTTRSWPISSGRPSRPRSGGCSTWR